MKIAICDDDANVLNQIRDYILKEVSSSNCEITCFTDGESLLCSNYTDVDIIFLDIEIGEMLGTEIAKTIRAQNPELVIFFVTSYTSYISEAFKSMPFQYLVKPIDERLFKEEFARAISIIKKQRATLQIRTTKGGEEIKISTISFIESLNRRIEINTDKEVFQFFGKMRDYDEMLSDFDFARCHISFLVNLKEVKSIKGKIAFLNNGKEIPISRTFLESFKEKVGKFLLRKRI